MDAATETDSPARQREDPTITDMLLSETEVLAIPTSVDLELLHATLCGLRAELDRAANHGRSA
ncbi:hypothetical protein APR12_005466 [Nocardia amikacinitolerans]|uniref:hypothetical protein n=1 Tax=Nocardia amikacinitolerans TaxID=756689 RepID=UPI00083737CB|nr:hypothetical protein [Nocardia amikacinitolerans]MCP2320085.1 hypothetical protein [Nocardia amikacinitolerans]